MGAGGLTVLILMPQVRRAVMHQATRESVFTTLLLRIISAQVFEPNSLIRLPRTALRERTVQA